MIINERMGTNQYARKQVALAHLYLEKTMMKVAERLPLPPDWQVVKRNFDLSLLFP